MASNPVAKLTAKDIMTTEFVSLNLDKTVQESIEILINNQISGAPILNQDNTLLGMVSEADLMKFAAIEGLTATLGSCRHKLPSMEQLIFLYETDIFREIFKKFLTNSIRRIPVKNALGSLVGIISRRDILKAFITQASEPPEEQPAPAQE